ncbi:MAG: ComF family protein [Candidatus Blackburnbacteria bacterium]|nr:ComF family protein [Candidatus Blackburnbacteria bacterium]
MCERGSIDGLKHKWCYKSYTPEGLIVMWKYEGAPRKLIAQIKYEYVSDLASELGEELAGFLKGYERSSLGCPLWAKDKFLVVPIPLHWKRKNWRGFNHTEEVARVLGSNMGWQVENLLERARPTKTQVGLKGKERRKNIQGVFGLSPGALAFRDFEILLFDDVWTTGSTVLEATRVLKEAGFRRVWCLTLAR